MTGCNCDNPGRCERHGIDKTPHWHHLCRTREDYFQAWEEGRGPGQRDAALRQPRVPCQHRSAGPIDEVPCELCGGRTVPVPVYQCDLFGRCTERRYGTNSKEARETPSCLGCAAYLPLGSSSSSSSETVPVPSPVLGETSVPRKLILESGLSPGDIVVMTAAVRELHRQYPGQFLTDVRTACPAIWEQNPYVTPLQIDAPGIKRVPMHYDSGRGKALWADINRSNQHPVHFLAGYCEHLARSLGLSSLWPQEFKGDIHLSRQEKSWTSQVTEITGEPTRFWIINAGGKSDFTAKIWPLASFQQVVDHFRERLVFVQVGEAGHLHPPLAGVIDLRGKTDLRQLIRLVYHSSGVLCGVTLLMHLSAAVECLPWVPRLRPCVVVAGGREPPHWEAYPGHQFLHTVGMLSCCAQGGCWRSRTVPLGDGSAQDRSLCEFPEEGSPRCLRLIRPERVIDAIEDYLAFSDYSVPPPPIVPPPKPRLMIGEFPACSVRHETLAGHHLCAHPQVFTPGRRVNAEICKACRFRSLPPPATEVDLTQAGQPGPCIFLGSLLGHRSCLPCGGNQRSAVYACHHPDHGETTLNACLNCKDYTAAVNISE